MSFELFPVVQWFDNNGNPLSGGLISTFAAGTTTPQATYTDSTGGTPQSNPIVLDAAGRAQIWFAAASYKLVLKTAAGVTLMTIDNVTLDNLAATISSLSMTGNLTLQQSTAATAIANQSSNLVKIQANYWNGVASAVDEWDVRNVLGSGTNPTSTLTFTHSGSSGTTSVDLPNLSFSNLTVTGALTATGANVLNAKTMEGVRYADQFSGSDMVAKILAAMTDMASTGGDIYVPAGTYVCTTQLLIPNDGATVPLQKSFRIIGAGMGTNSAAGVTSKAPNGGTILDMQFSATTGKIDTRGAGYLEISGITFKDSASDGTPFVFCTNTVLHLHDCAFFGSASGTSAVNTGIILGGTTAVQGGGATNDFQGYGTVIRDNQFHQIKTVIKFETDANAVIFENNNIWADCGDSAGAAILFSPTASNCSGNSIKDNLIELTNYKYGIWCKNNAFNNSLITNNMYDATATTTAAVQCDSGAIGNMVLEGFRTGDTKPGLIDGNATQQNVLITSHQNQTSTILGPWKLVDLSAGPGFQIQVATTDIPEYSLKNSGNSDEFYQTITTGSHSWSGWWKPLGAAAENEFGWKYYGANQYALQVMGSVFSALESPNGDLTLRPKSGNAGNLTDLANNSALTWTGGNVSIVKKITSYNGIATSGNGIPSVVASSDLTAQTAAIATTTLYAVPAAGAGQYRISWDSKVTTAAGVSSTLGPMTVIWTDPDGVTITTVVPAMVSGGGVQVTGATGNTTSTFLTGMPFLINAKASTNIQFSFAYASNAAAAMNYNLHIKLEQM